MCVYCIYLLCVYYVYIVVEVLDEDSRVEGCFKNKKFFIEELSSAQTILIASHLKCSAKRPCEKQQCRSVCRSLPRNDSPPVLVSASTAP